MIELHSLLRSLPKQLAAEVLHGSPEIQVKTIINDSREARREGLFVALRGSKADGHDFLAQARAQGCCCFVVEQDPGPLHGATVVRVNDSHAALGWLAAALHGFPAQSMTMIGLTGTNGKTTVSWLIEQMLQGSGCRVGVIGTVNYRYPDRSGRMVVAQAPLTTPGPVLLQPLLRAMADQGVTHVVLEASSHALYQGRLAGILFDVGVFTNLSRDHLDFHGSMEEYFAAKKLLFTRFLKQEGEKDSQAVIVIGQGSQDRDWGRQLCQELAAENHSAMQITCCGLAQTAAVAAKELRQDVRGFSCQIILDGREYPLSSRLTGQHNVLNLLAAAGAGRALGLSSDQIISGLSQVGQVPGRLERILLPGLSEEDQPCVLVDYAHTPDALENVLCTLRPLAKGKLICVFGCGGDRDKGKRPLMGTVVARFADLTLITSDNPLSLIHISEPTNRTRSRMPSSA